MDKLKFKENGFDWLRLYSAIMIVMGHCVIHLNINVPVYFDMFLNSWVGLFCLFTLTGYLLPASLERSNSPKKYLKKRFFRLYPTLWLALVVSLLCINCIGGAAGLTFNVMDIGKWLFAQVTFFQFYTPPSISAYGVGNPNGALWTISIEIQVYFLILFLWKWFKNQKNAVWIGSIIFSVLLNIIFGYLYPVLPQMVAKLINVTFIPYLYLFLCGMFMYARKESIVPMLAKYCGGIISAYIAWFLINYLFLNIELGHYSNIITGLFISLITIGGGIGLEKEDYVSNYLTRYMCII